MKAQAYLFPRCWSVVVVPVVLACGVGCASAPKAPVESAPRAPASSCQLQPRNEEAARKILAHPARYDRKIEGHLRGLVEGYLLGEELKARFDKLVDEGVPARELTESQVYAELQALKSIVFSIRSSLEDIFLVRINDALARDPSLDRYRLIDESLALVRDRIETLIQRGAHGPHVRLALASVAEDFTALRDYYASCDPERLAAGAEATSSAQESALREALAAGPLPEGAYRLWAPKERAPFAYPVARRIKRLALQLKVELKALLSRGREPQAAVIRPDTGSAGNITGNGFPKGVWALTYDDGPGPLSPKVLENLARHQLKATFFVLAGNLSAKGYPDLARREKAEGHAVEPHSFTHPQVPKLGPERRHYEIVKAAERVGEVIGGKPRFYRLPYGAGVGVASVRQKLKEAGLIHVFWNVDTLDWQDKNPDSIVQRALKQMRANGRGVILFHDVHRQSVVASERIMAYLKDPANGLQTGTIPEIVDRINSGQ